MFISKYISELIGWFNLRKYFIVCFLSPLGVKVINFYDIKNKIYANIDFESNPSAFRESWIERDNEIRQKIIHAKTILNDIEFPEKMIEIIAFLCGELGVDGYRPDIVIARSARALAALENNEQVKLDHIRAASFLALTHRTRQSGMKNPPTKEEIEEILLKSKKIAS